MTSLKTNPGWRRWFRSLADSNNHLSVELGGFPGHMRLPLRWKTRGKFSGEHLLYLVTEGKIQASISGKSIVVSSGGLIWIRPGTLFDFERGDTKDLTVLRCRFRVKQRNETAASPWPWRLWPGGSICLPWLEWLIREAKQPDEWTQTRLRGLLQGLFTDLARMDAAGPPSSTGLTVTQRQALADLLAERPDARATPRELAGAAGLSYDYFSRCFKRSYARTPRRWLLEQRIQAAILRLAETDLRVGEIARELGYADLFLFSRQFKAVTGLNPLAYRKSHSGPKQEALVKAQER